MPPLNTKTDIESCARTISILLLFLYQLKEKCLTYIWIFFSCGLGKKWRCIIWCKTRSIFDLGQSFEHVADHCQNYQIWWCGNTILTPNSSLNYTNLPLPLEGNHLARQIAETICSSIIYVCTQQIWQNYMLQDNFRLLGVFLSC